MEKKTLLKIVESMPDEFDVHQLISKLYILANIEAGERALAKQGGIPQAEVEQRYEM